MIVYVVLYDEPDEPAEVFEVFKKEEDAIAYVGEDSENLSYAKFVVR